jgi:iron complex outermembrane recepter protein
VRRVRPFVSALVVALALTRAARAQQGEVVPPEPAVRVDAIYPENAGRHEMDVVFFVTVDVDGRVSDVSVAQTGGTAFDTAAITAIRQWRFVPARQGATPIRARIRVLFHFDPPPPAASTAEPAAEPPHAPAVVTVQREEQPEVRVRGRSHLPSRGAGDYEIPIGKLALVPRADAASLLRLAPGTFLLNQGGTGHPYQIFLRGFDAREGQDIELTADGTPINEVGNVHGSGLADTHFIVPELVRSLRVVEGPFAPQQGNFAVAGSALYDFGLDEPGLSVKTMAGSFDTKRVLLMYKPNGSREHTFGGVEAFTSDGFGENRKSQRATAMGGYEGTLGTTGLYRFLLTSYATHYASAGVLREDDVVAGRKDFNGTYDRGQGGDSARHSAQVTLDDRIAGMRVSQSMFLVFRDFRLRQNLTGFQTDPQRTWQSPHAQRGDLADQRVNGIVFGGRGSGRASTTFLELPQELELGYFARYDDVAGVQQRLRSGSNVPYRTDLDLDSAITNLGLYADASVKPGVSWITVRGGARLDYFGYRVHDRCAQRVRDTPDAVPADTECFTVDRTGHRSADQTASTSAGLFQPRATVLLGPFNGFTLSASHGVGSRSLDPQYVNQDLDTPFAKVVASEGGIAYLQSVGQIDLLVKSVFFRTNVDRDLFFNPTEGRNTLADGTTRTGWAGNARATTRFIDIAGSATLVRATFDDTNLLIPYAPAVVLRADGAVFGDLPFKIDGHKLSAIATTGVSYVGKRPLPFDERSNVIFTVDSAVNVRWRAVQVGVMATNLFDRRYRGAEYNYASDFRSQRYPTLVPARHFVAGEPRAIFATLTLTLGGGGTQPKDLSGGGT